jgi:putative endonuclease
VTQTRQSLGRWGEAQAAQFLQSRGYTLLDRNARTPYGELDLIALHAGTLVIIEVKTRSSRAFGLPEEAITPRKQAHLRAAGEHYLQTHPNLPADWRVDVIAIRRRLGQPPEIVHFENTLS